MHTLLAIMLIGVTAAASPAAPVSAERVEGGLVISASVPKRTFAPGEPVPVRVTVRNVAGQPLGVTFTSGQRFDLIVRRSRGDEVWRWSHDKAFIQVIQTATLRPQEILPFGDTWDQRDLQGRRVDPGTYEIVVVFLGRVGEGRMDRREAIVLPPISITIAGR